MIWLNDRVPALPFWLIEDFEDNVRTITVSMSNVSKERNGLVLVLISVMIVPVNDDIDTE